MTLADEIIAQHVDIGRYSASVQQRILVLLEKMRFELTAKLATEDLTAFGKMRTEALLRQAIAIIDAHYAQIAVVVKSSTEAIVPLTARHAATALGASVTVQLGIGLPTATVLERLVSNVIIQGSPLEGWWAKQAADTAFRFSNAVRIGIAAGETNAQIITRLVGRPRLGIPGVMDITRKNAAALVQTATATVANAARAETFKANADVTPRVAWLATLDNLTCVECGVRDGLEWMNDKDHKPVGHKIPYSLPTLHPNCRCIVSGVTRGEFFDVPVGRRASMDGPVGGKTTFTDWIGRRTEAQIAEQFGAGRAELFKKGTITFEQFLSPRGNVLSLSQLKARYA